MRTEAKEGRNGKWEKKKDTKRKEPKTS